MKLNTADKLEPVRTHEGGLATRCSVEQELRRSVLTCLLWEDAFYEKGSSVAKRIAALVPQVEPQVVARLAEEARSKMQLRHVPLFLLSELSKVKGAGSYVAWGLENVVQRADELTEFLAIYWKDGKHPIASAVKRGLAAAFKKFDGYRLAKYDRESKVKLRDVMFLVHPKPQVTPLESFPAWAKAVRRGKYQRGAVRRHESGQGELWSKLITGTLETPDTWEVALSAGAGANKKESWERLLQEGKLGGLAVLRNLRNMLEAGVDLPLIRDRLVQGCKRALPFRFLVAAKYAPRLEGAIEKAMMLSVAQCEKLPGRTLLIVDVSGSMRGALSGKSEMNRMTAAAGLAILAREVCQEAVIYATAGDDIRRVHATMEIPARQGFALGDAICRATETVGSGGIFLVQCLDFIAEKERETFDRVIVFTDEQDCDVKANPATARKLGRYNYVVNVSVEKHGISYRTGWEHVDGWSERVLDYMREMEAEDAPTQEGAN